MSEHDHLTNMKTCYYFRVKKGTSSEDQFIWVECGVGDLYRQSLKLTISPGRADSYEEDGLNSKKSKVTTVHGFKKETHKKSKDQIEDPLRHNKWGWRKQMLQTLQKTCRNR